MLHRLAVSAMARWKSLRKSKENDRGDSPIPTVIIWIGVAAIALGVLTWAGVYINSYESHAQQGIPAYTPASPAAQ